MKLHRHPIYIVAFRRRHLELLNLRGSTILTGHYIMVGSLKYITFKVREKSADIIANKTWKVSPTDCLDAAQPSREEKNHVMRLLCNIVNFMTGCVICYCLGLVAP